MTNTKSIKMAALGLILSYAASNPVHASQTITSSVNVAYSGYFTKSKCILALSAMALAGLGIWCYKTYLAPKYIGAQQAEKDMQHAKNYYEGKKGLQKNFSTAVNFYTKVLKNSHADQKVKQQAYFYLGKMYLSGGYNLTSDEKKALAYFEQAAAIDADCVTGQEAQLHIEYIQLEV